MQHRALRSLAALLLICLSLPTLASAQSRITITDGGVEIAFPDSITFSASVASSAPIARVVLEYGVVKLTCGEVVAKAFPDFRPGTSVDVRWTWEMRQSGSEPPGTTIWYRWRVTDASGAEQISSEQRVIWLDEAHQWRSASEGKLTLHWYSGSQTFAQELLSSAVDSLDQLGRTTGVTPQSPIDLYIYASTADMREAVLYEPGWTGGQAFPDHDIVIIGISPKQIEWGKRTEAHELTHVLVGHLTFSCLGSVPTWLNEGIAVYGEGGLEPPARDQLRGAIADDTLISVRALSGGFSEHPGKADLSYAQSHSLVDYLVSAFGQRRIVALFGELRQGETIEGALERVYSFGLDGLEDRWRESVGARPRRAEGASPTATAPPTPVPTYRPVDAAKVVAPLHAATLAPAPQATVAPARGVAPVPDTAAAAPRVDSNSMGMTAILGFLALIVVGGIVAVVIRKRRSAD